MDKIHAEIDLLTSKMMFEPILRITSAICKVVNENMKKLGTWTVENIEWTLIFKYDDFRQIDLHSRSIDLCYTSDSLWIYLLA